MVGNDDDDVDSNMHEDGDNVDSIDDGNDGAMRFMGW